MRILKYLFLLSSFISTDLTGQWCCLDSVFQIKDFSTVNLRLLIGGATNNNLSSPGQGVCGVKIKFEHKFIGDLTMELISPGGQRVKLIGPVGNSGNSDFSKWFVTFRRCQDTVNPDAGFKPVWDNIQSWGILGKFYSGTYKPNMGCLEDFNMGTVNGTWTLSVKDDERFYEGKIESFCLLFCDPSGINCQDCSPNGGVFNQTNITACQDDLLLIDLAQIQFPVFIPDQVTYSYKYIVSTNDTILDYLDTPDLRSYPAGDYLICGISFLRSDSLKLPLKGSLFSAFKNDLVANINGFCAELSKNCVHLKINPAYNGQIIKRSICHGDSILIDGQWLTTSGNYPVNDQTSLNCDSNIIVRLDVINFDILANAFDTLDCFTKSIHLDISRSNYSSGTLVQWSTQDGRIIDLSNPFIPEVDQPGLYKVVFSNENCRDSSIFQIIKKDDLPKIQLVSDTLNCLKNTVDIHVRSDAINPLFKWSDGRIDLGVDSILKVSNPGLYWVSVTDISGCTHMDSVYIEIDTAKAIIDLFAEEISCRNPQATIYFHSNLNRIDHSWSGPNMFSSKLDSAIVSASGLYYVALQSQNGCWSFDSVYVQSKIRIPDFWIIGDTMLNCANHKSIMLNANTQFVLDSIVYTGPSGFYSNKQDPVITSPGLYKVVLYDTAGCKLDTFFQIGIDTATAKFQLQGSVLDCINDSVQLKINYLSADTGIAISWTGPSRFSSTMSHPFVREVGLYTVEITSPNGCIATDTITIHQDNTKPLITFFAKTLDCNNSEITIQTTVTDAIRYQWSGPNGFLSVLEDPVVQDSGLYKLLVTASNGCTSEKSIFVSTDRSLPIDSLSAGIITCNQMVVPLILHARSILDTIEWNGPLSFTSAKDTNWIDHPGNYFVLVRGKNGCVDSASISVFIDTSKPQFQILADTLDCSQTFANIRIIAMDSTYTYLWISPAKDSMQTKDISVQNPGNYRAIVTSLNGCQKSDSIQIIDRRNLPKYDLVLDSITCFDSIADIQIKSLSGNLRIQWTGPNNYTSADSIVQLRDSGWYNFILKNDFDCQILDSFYLNAFLTKPVVQYSNPVFDCSKNMDPKLSSYFIDSLIDFEWIIPNGTRVKTRNLVSPEAGWYQFIGVNQYGCQVQDSLLVHYDTMKPVILTILMDTLNCLRTQVVPLVESNPVNIMYSWNGPMSFSSNLSNPILKTAGIYTLTIRTSNFCTKDTLIQLVIDSISPRVMTQNTEVNCKEDSVDLIFTSVDLIKSVFWQNSKGELLTGISPTVVDSGWYTIVTVGRNECLSLDSVYVGYDKTPPVILLSDGQIPCDPDSVRINNYSNEPGVTYTWTGPNMFNSNQKSPFVRDTGTYIVIATAANYCKSKDSLNIRPSFSKLQLEVHGDTLNCIDSVGELRMTSGTTLLKFLWSGPGLLDSINFSPRVSQSGIYKLSIVDIHNCKKDTFVNVIADTLKPSIQINTLDTLICERNEAELFNLFLCSSCNYQWSHSGGSILSDRNMDTIKIKGPGVYTLKVEDLTNGCFASQDYPVVEIKPDLNQLIIETEDPNCFGYADGSFVIQSIQGGHYPYLFSLDGINFSDIYNFNNKASGIYRVFIKDSYGCRYDTIIKLTDPPELQVSLGNDTTIRLGQSVSILPKVNTSPASIQQIFWNPEDDLDCTNCFNVTAHPKNQTRYLLTIVDENGCEASDDIVIYIVDKPNIYIPNAFTPNQDQINDYLIAVSPDEIVDVEFFRVFDRWGNLLYSNQDFELTDQTLLWDGRSHGQVLNPGVYIYQIGVNLINGKQYFQSGEINLIR